MSRDPRRLFPRYRRRFTVHWTHQGQTRAAFSVDVSAAGMFILSPHVPPPGERVEVEIQLPGSGPVHLVGEVVWRREVPRSLHTVARGGFGVRLLQAPETWYEYCAELDRD